MPKGRREPGNERTSSRHAYVRAPVDLYRTLRDPEKLHQMVKKRFHPMVYSGALHLPGIKLIPYPRTPVVFAKVRGTDDDGIKRVWTLTLDKTPGMMRQVYGHSEVTLYIETPVLMSKRR